LPLVAVVLVQITPAPSRQDSTLPGKGLAQHPFLYCGEWDTRRPDETIDKKVVWALRDWVTLGPASSTQLLDEPGVPEKGEQQR
jgi:hypothetical protein